MRRTLRLLLLAIAMMTAPLTFAHDDQLGPGTPDFTCQSPAEWAVHDYAGANGRTVADISDNNLEECGTTYGLFIAGTPECREIEDRLGQGPGSPLWELLCHTDRPADYDGDLEFAIGGALLAVTDGDGTTSGTIVCLGTDGHHPVGGPIWAQDQVFAAVVFRVGADNSLVPPPEGEPDCGDNVTRPCTTTPSGLGPEVDMVLALLQSGACNPNDHLQVCFNSCGVGFGPGAEGTYIVWVHPTLTGCSSTDASHGHVGTGTPPSSFPEEPAPGVGAAIILFDDDGGDAPCVTTMPGWSCSTTGSSGTSVDLECSPSVGTSLFAASNTEGCVNPFARAGGTFMTTGQASASVSCREVSAGPCNTNWVASQGGCDVKVIGSYHYPLKCNVSASGTVITPGAKFYAVCGTGDP